MNTKTEESAPYAPPSNVISVLRKFRESGLPWPLTAESLTHIGISQGNAPRTLATLKFLGLVDDDGERTKDMDSLAKASEQEYREVLAEIVKSAYSYVFSILDPSTANDLQLNDAFRRYSPQKQRGRMVTLFIGLCKESNIIEGQPTVIERSASATKRSRLRDALPIIVRSSSGQANPNYSLNKWAEKLKPMLEKLPDIDKAEWSSGARSRWINALSAFLDLYITVSKEEVSQDEIPF